ncbi:MAG: 4'-phosphopantetheinyl transferase superfamily protein [Clostridia bacterium]|nr:4'-phosphopantetheinyl transferase superfamily protein [Clostridia bacterium]
MITVYYADAPKDAYEKYVDRLSPSRREKASSFKFLNDQNMSVTAGLLIDEYLKTMGLREKDMEYEGVKPRFKDLSLFFNISHSKGKVMVAFSDKEIGSDIEVIEKEDLKVAKRFFCEEEYEVIKEDPSYFFRFWTLKESYIKFTGEGLRLPLNSFKIQFKDDKPYMDGVFLKELDLFSGYRASICAEKEDEITLKKVAIF